MFNFIKKSRNKELTQIHRESYLRILTKLDQVLINAGLKTQAEVVQILINLLGQQSDEKFIKLINGVDMWGGSGAVWEVHIENKDHAREFEKEVINLISLMEETKILGKGIRPIQKIFQSNLKK